MVPTGSKVSTLNPGEWLFGGGDHRIRTLLGSCVAATFWHPRLRLGGICHYVLPERPRGIKGTELDPKYGTEALALLSNEALRAGAKPAQYVVNLFGGGNMFPETEPRAHRHVGAQNVALGQRLLAEMGYTISAESVAGSGYRTLHFDLNSGDVWMRYRSVEAPEEKRHVRKR